MATSAGGRSQISAPLSVNVQATAAGGNRAPRTKLANLTAGQKIKVGAELSIVATATDPDGGSALRTESAADGAAAGSGGGARTKAAPTGSIIKAMDFYLNQAKVATATRPPYTARITPPAATSR